MKKRVLPSILISMGQPISGLSYLPEEEAALLSSSQEGEVQAAALLHPGKIGDEEFLEKCPNAKPHPFVPHSYLYRKEEYPLGKSFLFDVGAFYLQDPSAMMASYLLAPKPGEVVLDMCAAPGGKTIGAALLLGEDGIVLSNDVSYPRSLTLSQNVERMGLGNVILTNEDLTLPHPKWNGRFGAILLDAPCSGMAMFRKNEQAKEEWSPAKVARFAEVQAKLLQRAAAFLAPGGRILYSTCSFAYEENEGQIASFLSMNKEFKAIRFPIDDPSFFHGETIPEAITLFPHRFAGEGQFLCLLQKEGESETHPRKKYTVKGEASSFLKRFGLAGRHAEIWKGQTISLPFAFDIDGKIIRKGLICLDEKGNPAQALARYLPAEKTLPLDEKQARLYLHGDTFPYPGQGYVCFRYEKRPIGWAKIVNGLAKNHYPKGLRHVYESL